jgi:hypothetical protein
MRLVEFLIQLLEAQAETLKRLAALLGEENLVLLLEMAGDEESGKENGEPATAPQHEIPIPLFGPPQPPFASRDPYTELEGAVREMDLPATLNFHLWAYPPYRAFIESPLDLNSRLPGPGGEAGAALVEEAMAQAEAWVRRLPISPLVYEQASRAAHVPWIKFRAAVLKRVGRRPLGPVY